MTDGTFHMLTAWLDSGTDEERVHAANRLSLPDAIGYVPGPAVAAPQPPAFPVIWEDPDTLRILACPHYQPGCCASPAPYCDRFNIVPSRERCIECLGGSVAVDVPEPAIEPGRESE